MDDGPEDAPPQLSERQIWTLEKSNVSLNENRGRPKALEPFTAKLQQTLGGFATLQEAPMRHSLWQRVGSQFSTTVQKIIRAITETTSLCPHQCGGFGTFHQSWSLTLAGFALRREKPSISSPSLGSFARAFPLPDFAGHRPEILDFDAVDFVVFDIVLCGLAGWARAAPRRRRVVTRGTASYP